MQRDPVRTLDSGFDFKSGAPVRQVFNFAVDHGLSLIESDGAVPPRPESGTGPVIFNKERDAQFGFLVMDDSAFITRPADDPEGDPVRAFEPGLHLQPGARVRKIPDQALNNAAALAEDDFPLFQGPMAGAGSLLFSLMIWGQ